VATSVDTAGRTTVKAEPNVVPMIDIMLVLLIIFMIVTPLLTSGFEAKMPTADNIEKRPEEDWDITLGIDRQGGYFLQGNAISAADLELQLKSLYAEGKRPEEGGYILYLRADHNVPLSKIQDAVEITRRAGIKVIEAVSEEKIQVLDFGKKGKK